uniref:Uncharacterized protein n=1 Tax=Romanomermis culicivorax TaxID=13658 RepID=A0A915KYN6_ROMCU
MTEKTLCLLAVDLDRIAELECYPRNLGNLARLCITGKDKAREAFRLEATCRLIEEKKSMFKY